MQFIYQYRNMILAGVIFLTVVLLLMINIVGNNQDEQFVEDQKIFNYAEQLLVKGKSKQALTLLKTIESDYKDNHLVMWYTGWALMGEEKHDQAFNYYLNAQELNPVLTRRPIFLNQFADVLSSVNRDEEAKAYLARIEQLSN